MRQPTPPEARRVRSPMERLLRIEASTAACMGVACSVFGLLALVSVRGGDTSLGVSNVLFAAFFFAVGARMLLVEIPRTKRLIEAEMETASRYAQAMVAMLRPPEDRHEP